MSNEATWPSATSGGTTPSMVGVAVRVHSRTGDDLGICHVPPPVEVGDELELGYGPILPLRIVDLVETGQHSPLAALVKRPRRCSCASAP